MKTELVPLNINHFYALGAQHDAKVKLEYGKGWALLADGCPVSIGGVVSDPARPGVGKAWTLHVKDAENSPFLMRRIHGAVKCKIHLFKEQFNRIECETFPNSIRHYSWLIFFGFNYEGIARLFTGTEDRARFAWIK